MTAHFPDPISLYAITFLETIEIDAYKVLRRIRLLDCNKPHGWDNMLASIVKICGSSVALPLCLIYETCLHTGVFPDNWEKVNILPVHKKESCLLKKNY